ncbi:MAG: DNA polymerase I [Clostridiales bacterium]|nr:DNA polymerase I [Candidatus Cacconaster stercorequi]
MKLMVLDGNSIINRAYYGIRPLTTRDGLYTHAVYGFLTTLQRLLDEEQPEAVCVTFDRREPTFRHLADENYKATRHGMPEELAVQMPVLKEVLDAMNIPRYELSGYEADDLLGTISRKCQQAGWECVVVTGDKDSLQLITERTKVKLVSTRMGQTTTRDMTVAAFREQYGFDPIHMIDLKALMGDSSDNIPGVPGVGEKTAMALIQKYQSIENIYERLPDIEAKPNVIKKLTEGQDSARKSQYLATIVTDAPLEFVPERNLRQAFKPELYDIFLRLEFKKLIDKYDLRPAEVTMEAPEYHATVETVMDEKRAGELLTLWRRAAQVTVYALPDISAVAVECDTGADSSTMALLFAHRYEGDWNGLLKALFAADIAKVSHGVKDLMRMLLQQGIDPNGFVFDTALGAYLLDATAAQYDIDRLFISYFNAELPQPLHLETDAFSLLGDTAAAEASLCSWCSAVSALHEAQEPKLREREMWELFTTVELPLCRVLAEMEFAGFRCDGRRLADFGEMLLGTIRQMERQIYDAAGSEFNINSPKQLGKVLFEDLQLPHGKKTKTGWSTNADVLEKLRHSYPIVEDVLTYRQYSKLKSTYADGLLKVIDPDSRVRTCFQMTVTATGRLSSTEPNLQNIPTRTELGSQMRKMFTAEEGNVLVDADYSQIELRLLAHIAGDEAMISAFLSGADFHTVTAAKVFHVEPSEVTSEMRRRAKAVNFGIVYGISAFSLSQDIGVTVAEAKEYMDRYFATYPGVAQYMEDVVAQAKETGYVETLLHRRRDLPELISSNHNLRAFGERVALNMPIQGTAADIIKLAMVRVHQRLKNEGLQAKLIMQVHDELIVECPQAEQETVKRILREEMEGAAEVSVPLIAEAHSGSDWLSAKG